MASVCQGSKQNSILSTDKVKEYKELQNKDKRGKILWKRSAL